MEAIKVQYLFYLNWSPALVYFAVSLYWRNMIICSVGHVTAYYILTNNLWKFDEDITLQTWFQICHNIWNFPKNAFKSDNLHQNAVTSSISTYQIVGINQTYSLWRFGEDTTCQTWMIFLIIYEKSLNTQHNQGTLNIL